MHPDHDRSEAAPRTSPLGGLFLLGFGLALLVFLVAIDRPEWFHIRPASGTATAMAFASDGGGAKAR